VDYDQFENLVRDAFKQLPDWVVESLQNVEILVLDEPEDDFDPVGEGLLGLYTGIPLPERGVDYVAELPDVIYIFRLPHLELGLSPKALFDEIYTTLVHEIAHYFGFGDDRLDELGLG
jgi:predicted Zn-dependent protease with MMP-like domain